MADITAPAPGAAGGSETLAPPLDLPDPSELSPAQVCGRACLWCHVTLDNAVAVDLGARDVEAHGSITRWYPRSCRPCEFQRVYGALLNHTQSCEQCADDLIHCEPGTALRKAMRVVRG